MQKLLLFPLFICLALTAWAQPHSENEIINCGYQMHLTAVDKHLVGSLKANSADAPALSIANWYNAATGELLSQGPEFNYDVAEYDTYVIKVVYQTLMLNGGWGCTSEQIRELQIIEPSCILPFPLTQDIYCEEVFAPVCGCNGITYNNECEARQAGVSKWWAGECASQPSPSGCGITDLNIEVVSGSPATGYTVRFSNLAGGNFTNIQLDFGDNSPIDQTSQWQQKEHFYPAGGIYNATLTAWNISQPGCISSVTSNFATDAYSMVTERMPNNSDYVMPGDGNGDGKANVYDLLRVGKAYATPGAPRPEASTDWAPQYAPEWPVCTQDGLNYKHIDSNGDGVVNEFDISPIEMHYQPVEPWATTPVDEAPKVFVQFDQDTIFVNPDNPQNIQITANIHIGTPDKPIFGLYGMACALRYPDFVAHNPTMLYDPSFFGASNYVLSFGHDNYGLQQYDFGISHKSGQGANGYGRVAQVSFRADYIIIIDIIDRADEDVVALTIPVEGIVAVDATGKEKLLTTDMVLDTIWVKKLQTSGTTNNIIEQGKVRIFPNPASETLLIEAKEAEISSIELLNALGQRVLVATPTVNGKNQLDISNLARGVYTIHVVTTDGAGAQKIIIE